MDLNAYSKYHQLDKSGMYQSIMELPAQLAAGYELGFEKILPEIKNPRLMVIAGMGGSAIAADLLTGCFSNSISIPIFVNRSYHLPKWASGKDVLVICSSHSGNTEETVAVYQEACARACTPLVISTGGSLSQSAKENEHAVWKFEHAGQPRAALGWSFGLLLAVFTRLKFLPDQEENIQLATREMLDLIENNKAEIIIPKNPAKRLAGQLVGKYVTVFGAEHLNAVARRWKTQINELAKSWAQYEAIPEANHNTIAGTIHPQEQLLKIFSIFLQSSFYFSRNQSRIDLSFTELMVAGIGTDKVGLRGTSRFSDMWIHILFGDLISYYLAILNEEDPTPVIAIESFKEQLG